MCSIYMVFHIDFCEVVVGWDYRLSKVSNLSRSTEDYEAKIQSSLQLKKEKNPLFTIFESVG